MRSSSDTLLRLLSGGTAIALAGMIAMSSAAAAEGISIDAWLSSERNNANLAQALEALDRAKAPPAATVNARQPRAETAQGGVIPQRETEAPQPGELREPREFDPDRIKRMSGSGERPPTKYYVAGNLGGVMARDAEFTNSFNSVADLEPSKLGLYAAGSFGINFPGGWSTEVQLSYQSADPEKLTVRNGITGATSSSSNVDGSISALSVMANARYAFPAASWVSPYVMAGFGISGIAFEDIVATGVGTVDFSTSAPAYQGGVGLLFPLAERTSLEVGYRYFGALDMVISGDSGGSVDPSQFASHTVMVGLQQGF